MRCDEKLSVGGLLKICSRIVLKCRVSVVGKILKTRFVK